MGVDRRAPLPRHMFDDTDDAPQGKTIKNSTTQRSHAHRVAAQGAIANGGMRIGHADIKYGQAIDIDTDFSQRERNSLRIAARRLNRGDRGNVIQRVKRPASGKIRPDRRTHPRDTAALLVNQDGHIVAPMQRPQTIGQCTHLRAVFDIAFEQDIACWLDIAKQAFFVICQGQAR